MRGLETVTARPERWQAPQTAGALLERRHSRPRGGVVRTQVSGIEPMSRVYETAPPLCASGSARCRLLTPHTSASKRDQPPPLTERRDWGLGGCTPLVTSTFQFT